MTPYDSLQANFTPRILVVDDEKRIRDGCRTILTGEGIDVSVAETGDQGLAMINCEHYDVILMDLMMPGISGLEALAKVKAAHPDTAVIIITGYATVEHSIEAMKSGAFDFIPKPFSPDQLRIVVTKALDYIRTLKDIATEKSRIKTLINHLRDGVLATDAHKNVVLTNPAFLKQLGCSHENIIGQPMDQITNDQELLDIIDNTLAVPEEEFTVLNREIKRTAQDTHDEKWLSAQCIPFRDREGRTLGAVTVLHDITELKKMDQIKSDFVSMVAHEIRGPINSVLMQFKVVLDGLAGALTPKQGEILTRSSEKLKGLVEMATELLDIARIESGLLTQEKELVSIEDILADQMEFHRAKAAQKNIRIELDAPPALPSLIANRRNLEEVFSNLISNAIKYSPDGGLITIRAGLSGEYLGVSIIDAGFGIPRESLNKIFERFYRVKNETTRHIIGTGLGLPIVKSIVDAHNGRIEVDSEVGHGSTFTVYFPITSQ